jgi:hypothetical protein
MRLRQLLLFLLAFILTFACWAAIGQPVAATAGSCPYLIPQRGGYGGEPAAIAGVSVAGDGSGISFPEWDAIAASLANACSAWVPTYYGTALPGTCTEPSGFYRTDTDQQFWCTAEGVWTLGGGGDLEEEEHGAEHHQGGSDQINAEDLGSACENGAPIEGDGAGGVQCGVDAGGVGAVAEADRLYVRDEKTSGTAGGASSVGWQTRTLNAVVADSIGATLGSNLVTLPAGDYWIRACGSAYKSGRHKLRVWDDTNSATLLVGGNAYNSPTQAVSTEACVEGPVNLPATTDIAVEHYIETAVATNGLGPEVGAGIAEVYAELWATAIAPIETVEVAYAGHGGMIYESFLDTIEIAEISGVSLSVNRPAKDASNPLLPAPGQPEDTGSDGDKTWASVFLDAGTWHMHYYGFDGIDPRGHYATSTDGVAWTKPNLGRVSYGGNTNNNITIDASIVSAFHDAANSRYLGVGESDGSGDGIYIYSTADTSPSGPWTLEKYINPAGYAEGKSVHYGTSGDLLAYFVDGHGSNSRSAKIYTNTAGGLTGTWTLNGTALAASSASDQRYYLAAAQVSDTHLGWAGIYNSTTGTIDTALYVSRDGISWSLKDAGWLPRGGAGTWDDSMVLGVGTQVEEADEWHYYYGGCPEIHSAPAPRDCRIGRASLGRGRIGQIAGTGSVETALLDVAVGTTLTINYDASGGGKIEIEVQDAAGATVANYAQADADDLAGDAFATEPTWGVGALTLPDGDLRLVFHLTDAVLYGYTIQ